MEKCELFKYKFTPKITLVILHIKIIILLFKVLNIFIASFNNEIWMFKNHYKIYLFDQLYKGYCNEKQK